MSRFMHESQKSPGDGSKLPLDKRLAKWAYNMKVSLFADKDSEKNSVKHLGRALKK